MHETAADVAALQQLLDRSYAAAGSHLRRITTPPRRVAADELVGILVGVRYLAVATTTADCRPMVAPVDSIFYRAAFYFGTSLDSVRAVHLRLRPSVSATHFEGEALAVTVHGTARVVDHLGASEHAFRRALLAVYTPRFGPDFEQFIARGVRYWRIDPQRMFTYASRDGVAQPG